MNQHALELEGLFEDHGVCSRAVTNSPDLEHVVYLVQPPPAALQLTNRQRGAQFLLDLTVTYARLAQTIEFALQVIGWTQVWPNETSGIIEYDDLLALLAAVYIHIELHFTPQQRHPRSFLGLLTAFAAQLLRRQLDDVPELHNSYTIQQIVHTGFRILRQLGYEVAILTPMNWIDTYRQ